MHDWLDEAEDAMNFGYDAVEDSGRRASPKRVVQSEDEQLTAIKRKVLNATTRDMRRNFTITRWVIQKHIDFVVEHNFMPDTGNESFNRQLKEFFAMASKRENFDISQRHSLRRYLRLQEAARLVDGDFMSVRMRGGYLQAIESDRIRNPDEMLPDNMMPGQLETGPRWVQGVEVNEYGRPIRYAVHRRLGKGFEYERTVSARKVISYGFYDRFDQVRGVTPLAAAINSLKDLYESFDYALAKAKVAQLFALSITREADWGFDDSDGEDNDGTNKEIDFNKGPQLLDLDAGEDAKFLTTDTPGDSTEAFWRSMTGLVLKSLGIPYSFYDEAYTNFFGSRSALILYLRSVRAWREDVVSFLNDWFCWRLKIGQLKGEIVLPEWFECDPKNWRWIPVGLEYWNPQQEAAADIALLQAGLRTREEIRRERYGDSWEYDVAPQLQRENKIAEEYGLPNIGAVQQPQPQPVEEKEDDPEEQDNEDSDE